MASENLEEIINAHCAQVYKKYKSQEKAAKALGICVKTLRKYLKRSFIEIENRWMDKGEAWEIMQKRFPSK